VVEAWGSDYQLASLLENYTRGTGNNAADLRKIETEFL
jgi:hypothetical protein